MKRYGLLFVDDNWNSLFIETFGEDKNRIQQIITNQVNQKYNNRYKFYSMNQLSEPSEFIYLDNV